MREAAKGTAGERSTAGDVARKGIKRRNAGKKGRREAGRQTWCVRLWRLKLSFQEKQREHRSQMYRCLCCS